MQAKGTCIGLLSGNYKEPEDGAAKINTCIL